ncbi:MAG TPA: 4-alpha-glucanotransferase [Ilumatobacteraceae bacterium]|nr:4-alpha-glucanotransferase [Ilumatobacteraceae bacterium]
MADTDTTLRVRARELGVQTSYHDVRHELHHADDVALERIVEVLEADRIAAASTTRLTPPLHTDPLAPVAIAGRVTAASISVEGQAVDVVVVHGDDHDLLQVPADLPLGCHRLSFVTDRGAGESVVVVAPAAMPRSADFERTAGLFVPAYALWEADRPLPSFRHLHELARSLKSSGIDVLATLPLYSTFLDDPFDPSPYSPISRLHWNEVYLDDEGLPDAPAPVLTDHVDWRALGARRRTQLLEATRRLDADQRVHLRAFVEEHPDVADYARFLAGREAGADEHVEASHVLAQHLADQQLRAIADDPNAAALALDLPIGSHPHGYEVWADGSMFADAMSVGAPPDIFFADGQDWGFPPPLPSAMHASGQRLWRDLIARVGRHADILRIDHAMAIERLWWVPAGLPAHQGAYVHYQREEILAVIAASASAVGVTIVGEDLGTVPPEVSDAFDRWDMLGMYEEQFNLDLDPLPHIPARVVAGIRTHDMAPLAVAVDELDTVGYRARVGAAHGVEVDDTWQDMLEQMLIRLSYSDAYLVIADLDDLVGETRPHNLPGRVVPEIWRRRLNVPTSELLADPDVQRRLTLLLRR